MGSLPPAPGDDRVGRERRARHARRRPRRTRRPSPYALAAARENARRAREIVSTELWETPQHDAARGCRGACSTDKVARLLPLGARALRARRRASSTRRRAATRRGSSSRSGARIERADMTARLLATRSLTEASGPVVDDASCARAARYEAYLRTYRGMPSADERAPSSCCWTGSSRDRSSTRSTGPRSAWARSSRSPTASSVDDARRRSAASARTSSTGRSIEILDDLPRDMEQVQRACSAASDAIRGRYFPSGATTTWVGEAL